jgi:hypothetical protein
MKNLLLGLLLLSSISTVFAQDELQDQGQGTSTGDNFSVININEISNESYLMNRQVCILTKQVVLSMSGPVGNGSLHFFATCVESKLISAFFTDSDIPSAKIGKFLISGQDTRKICQLIASTLNLLKDPQVIFEASCAKSGASEYQLTVKAGRVR